MKSTIRMVCDTLFGKDSYIIAMSDGAGAYRQEHAGIFEHHAVNHQEKEWTRPEEPVWNVETGDTRPTFASTHYIDSQWQTNKMQLPRGIGVSTPAGVKLKMLFVRAAQWRMMLRGQDKWEAFCKAHKAWREEQGAGISERAKQGGR